MKKVTAIELEPVFKTISSVVPASLVYRVSRVASFGAAAPLDPSGGLWRDVPVADVSHFHAESSADHRPRTEVRLVHDGDRLRALFDVHDRYVRCMHNAYQSMVSRDSCVEMFLQPPGSQGYFNFEFSCGGAMLVYFIEDPRRQAEAVFKKYEPLPEQLGRQVKVWSSLRYPIDPELTHSVQWQLACEIPTAVFSPYVAGGLKQFDGAWRGNFFKCADDTSHPHWAAWNPIGPVCRFHQPERFGTVMFDE